MYKIFNKFYKIFDLIEYNTKDFEEHLKIQIY
jgi:hypothetical protein